MTQAPKLPDPPKPKLPAARAARAENPADGYDTPSENCPDETIADEQRRRSDNPAAPIVGMDNPNAPRQVVTHATPHKSN